MSDPWRGKCYWLVGASEGLGRALAERLSAAGATLYLSARNADRLQELADALPGPAVVAPLDLRDAATVAKAFARINRPLDGMIFCAGLYEPLDAAHWDADAVEAMCDVNFTGAARVLGQAVPAMLAQGRGHIVLIGSLAGLVGLPRSIGYGASKAGVIHMAESLRADLPDAIKVQVINPGFIKTRLTDKNDFKMPFILSAEDAAARTVRLMERGRFRGYYPWRFAALFRIARLLPDWLYFRLV